MGKKINQAERVYAMLDETKVREHIVKHTLYPAVLIGGTRIGSEERRQYRCAHCKHEWEEVYQNHVYRYNYTIVCPKCKNPMFQGVKLPAEGEHFSHSPQLWDGIQLKNFRYMTYVDAATLDDTRGIIIAEYEPTVVYHFTDVPESFEVKLKLLHYGFVSASHKVLFNEKGTKTTKFLCNAFVCWNCIMVASEEAQQIRTLLPWMSGHPDYDGNSWLASFDRYWEKRVTSGRKPLGELHAEQTLSEFDIPEFPEVIISAKQIVGRDVSEDVITGKHHMEYCCMSCGARFSNDMIYNRANVECPVCGTSTGRDSRLVIGSTNEDVGIISMLYENTVLIRAGRVGCVYDENFNPESC